MKVMFKLLSNDAKLPSKKNKHDAGIDLYSPISGCVNPGESKIIPLDVAWEFRGNGNYYLQIKSRSGLAFGKSIEVTNAGVIDSTYRGNIGVKLYNDSNVRFFFKKGDRICQGIVIPLPHYTIEEVSELSDTSRGSGGFGSTGE